MSFGDQFKESVIRAIELYGGDQPLAKEMAQVVGVRHALTRKQIRKIANGNDLALSCHHLEAFDRFLQLRMGTSLTQMLQSPNLIETIASRGDVTFIVGSQPEQKHRRIDVSRWDVLALRDLMSDMCSMGHSTQMHVEDVIFRGREGAMFACADNVSGNERWFPLVTQAASPDVIVIGSPKANHCAEVVGARLFETPPFVERPPGSQIPFAFVWPRNDVRAETVKSVFSLDIDRDINQLRTLAGWSQSLRNSLRRRNTRDLAIVFNGGIHAVRRPARGGKWDTYGVLIARSIGSRIFVCLMGLTGPATRGCAQMVKKFCANLARTDETNRPLLAWAVVKVGVSDERATRPKYRCDERSIVEQQFATDVQYIELSATAPGI